jgi:sporulation protein YlmC with PRC-barrel domain
MNNKNLLNLALLLVVATLAFIIYQSEETSTELDRLSNIEIDDEVTDITSLVIEHNGRRTKLEKNADNQWQITEPVSIAANNFRINSILKLATAPIHNSYPISQLDADKIGLGRPDASHTERSDNTTIVSIGDKMLRFGIISPVTNLRYIQVGENVYTIEDVYYPLLSSHFGTLVSLSLLPESNSIEKLVLINQTISKDANGRWQSNTDTSADGITAILEDWRALQAFGIHEYMQRNQLGEVLVYLEGKETPISFQITDTDPWLILARPELGLEYHLDVEAYDKLIAPQ